MAGKPAGTIGSLGAGVCTAHKNPTPYKTTMADKAVPTVLINKLPAAVVGTTGIATCGHPTTALIGSKTVIIGGRPAHRLGDTGANFGPYALVTGVPTVIIG